MLEAPGLSVSGSGLDARLAWRTLEEMWRLMDDGSCGKDTTVYNLNLRPVLCLSGNRLIPSSASISNQDLRSLIQPTASLSRQPYPSPTPQIQDKGTLPTTHSRRS